MRTRPLSAVVAVIIALLSTSAHAALNISSITISGIDTGYVWDTANSINNTVFVTQFLRKNTITYNSSSELISIPVTLGDTAFSILGDGQPVASTTEASISYLITVGFSNGVVIGGIYNSAFKNDPNGGFIGTTARTIDNVEYSLSSFDWNRSTGRGADTVGPKETGMGGDSHDYSGQFAISAITVPEPATWIMMFAGFGMIGTGLRAYHKGRMRVTHG